MSKPRFKLYAEIDTLAHANTIKTAIQNQLAGKDIFETHSLDAFLDSETGKNVVIAQFRFNNDIDRDSIRDWARDQVQNNPQVKIWTQAAKLSWHTCTHDDANVQDCRTTNYAEFVK